MELYGSNQSDGEKEKEKKNGFHTMASYSSLRNLRKTRCPLVQILFEVLSVRIS